MTTSNILSQLGSPGVSTGFKNRLINGGMTIDQRNAGASVTATTDGIFYLDRWSVGLTQSSKLSVQQNAGSVTPPVGFTNYLGITSSSAYSIAAGDIFVLNQKIEGFNTSDLGWGTANAKTVTLSFWVRSSLTGTFGGSVKNSAANRSYPFTYTINSANTWEYETITIAGDTTGTWLTTNGTGLGINFSLGTGSTFSGAAGVWAATNLNSATGATSVVGTSGATFYITGVQLEVGTTATNFDFRSYGTELALCQRYYQRTFQSGSAFGANNNNATSWYGLGKCHVTMRATPTVSIISGVTPTVDFMGSGTRNYTSGTPSGQSVNSWKFDMNFSSAIGSVNLGVINNDCIECSAEL